MKSHYSTLITRMVNAALKVSQCRYKVVACGVDHRNRLINLSTNVPYLRSRGRHAEERVIFNSPKSLKKIYILRVGPRGNRLPIDPCRSCLDLANKRGIRIISI